MVNYHGHCNVIRTRQDKRTFLHPTSGRVLNAHIETVTRVCGQKLYSVREHLTGVCHTCASGWELPGVDEYATAAEKDRALAAGAQSLYPV